MNPVFVFLVLLATVLLWFLLAGTFKLIGKFVYRIGKDAIDEMNKEEKEKENEE